MPDDTSKEAEAPNDPAAAKPAEEAKKTPAGKDDKPSMHVRVSSPFKVFFNEQAYSISGINGKGPFDILPRHHNFISLVDACELVIRTRSGDSRVKISGGIMHVKADQVVVFLNV